MNNKKRNIIFICIIVIIPLFVIIYSNFKSFIKVELNPPFDGVVELASIDGKLVVISKTNEMHVRDWNNITQQPVKIQDQVEKIALIADNKYLMIPSDKPATIEINSLDKESSLTQLSLGYNVRCNFLSVNRAGNTAGLVIVNTSNKNNNDSYSKFTIDAIDSNQLNEIATIDNSSNDIELFDLNVSDDSRYIAVIGQKNKLGWIGMIDVNEKKLLWEKSSELSSRFNCAAFSPDNKIIYIGGAGRNVLIFNTATGELTNKLQMPETIVANKKQYTPAIATSNDGHVVATATEPAGTIYLWDTKTNQSMGRLPVGHILISGIAFSPDDKYLAASGVLMKNKIKICKVAKASK